MGPIDEKTRVSCLTWHCHMQGRLMNAPVKKKQLSSSWSIRGRSTPKVIWAEIMK